VSGSKTLYGWTALSYEDLLESRTKNKIELEYYKLKNTKEKYNMVLEDSETYGIEIVKKEYLKNDELKIETSEVKNITNNENLLDKILNTLKVNKVTPISLEDVMYDLVKIGSNY